MIDNDISEVVARPEGVYFRCMDNGLNSLTDDETASEPSGAPPVLANQTFLYFIREGRRGPIKIGYAIDPKTRLIRLQTGTHRDLTLIAWVPGSQKDERDWHRRFSHLRIRGEWFLNRRELRDAIAPLTTATLDRLLEIQRAEDRELLAAVRARTCAEPAYNSRTAVFA